jgi:hypothetical protein
MTLKTYKASCHCGDVRFEADIDLSNGTNRCNCSICTKARAWFTFAGPNGFRLISGADSLTEYQWTPPGRPEAVLHYHFCKKCGIRAYAWGDHESMGGRFYAVSVAALDGVNPDELAGGPIKFVDGRNDNFNQPPADTRFL